MNCRWVAVHDDFNARVCDALGDGRAFAPVFQRELFVEVPPRNDRGSDGDHSKQNDHEQKRLS